MTKRLYDEYTTDDTSFLLGLSVVEIVSDVAVCSLSAISTMNLDLLNLVGCSWQPDTIDFYSKLVKMPAFVINQVVVIELAKTQYIGALGFEEKKDSLIKVLLRPFSLWYTMWLVLKCTSGLIIDNIAPRFVPRFFVIMGVSAMNIVENGLVVFVLGLSGSSAVDPFKVHMESCSTEWRRRGQ